MRVDEQVMANHMTTSETVTASAISEKLTVEKRLVETGAVRVRKLIHEDHVAVDIPLTTEVAQIDRVKIDKVVTGPQPVRHEGDVMIVPVVEERLVTYTELVLVEEIHITRRHVEQLASQEVIVRREEIIVERRDISSGEWQTVADDSSASNA